VDYNLKIVDTFNEFVKPTIYSKINPFITELTGITTEQLVNEKNFVEIFNNFINFINSSDAILCTWGMSDIKELYKNAEYHKLNKENLPKMYINIQPFVSLCLGFSTKNLLKLQHAVELLNIPLKENFHDALNDAVYTAEIFKKIYNPSLQPKIYDPSYVRIRQRQPKKIIDFEALIKQFEKMYGRQMTDQEQEIIKLAYKMGKTGQFIK
jgi:DNA polymerase III epsilon subunit-like protein